MALKAVITQEEYDGLEEAVQGLYRKAQKGDTYILDITGVDEHPSVVGLKNTLSKYREVAPDAKAMLKIKTDYDALVEAWADLDPEETKASLTRLAELDAGAPDISQQIEAAREAMRKKHEKELAERQTEIDGLKTQLGERSSYIEELTTDRELEEGLSGVKVLPELREAAKALIYRKYAPKAEESKDELNGKTTYATKLKTKMGEVTSTEFFEWWTGEDEAQAFLPASGNSGTGSRSSEGNLGRGKKNPWSKDHWNMTEQSRIYKENPALAKRLASDAGHTLVTS